MPAGVSIASQSPPEHAVQSAKKPFESAPAQNG
jgi:hypothetical protein